MNLNEVNRFCYDNRGKTYRHLETPQTFQTAFRHRITNCQLIIPLIVFQQRPELLPMLVFVATVSVFTYHTFDRLEFERGYFEHLRQTQTISIYKQCIPEGQDGGQFSEPQCFPFVSQNT